MGKRKVLENMEKRVYSTSAFRHFKLSVKIKNLTRGLIEKFQDEILTNKFVSVGQLIFPSHDGKKENFMFTSIFW